jgi:O-antigen ligase
LPHADDTTGLGRWSGILFAGVLAAGLWAPIPFGSIEPWAVGLLRLAALGLVVVWALACASRGVLVIGKSPLQVILYAAAALAFAQSLPVAGAPVSVDPFLSRQSATTLLAFAAIFSIALVALDSRERLERAALALFIAGFVLSVFAILQSLSGTTKIYWIRETTAQGFFGPYPNKNHFAGLMEVLLPMGLGPLAAGAVPRERRLLVAFGGLVIATALVLSRSRGGLFSVAAELVALVLLAVVSAPARGGSRVRAATVGAAGGLALIVAVALGVFWVGSDAVANSLADIPDAVASESPISRNVIWRDTFALVRDHPVLGTGIGAYETAFGAYTQSTGYARIQHAHSDYLQVLADAGAAGAVLAILFAVTLGIYVTRGVRRTDSVTRGVALGAACGCIGLLIHSFVDFNMQIPSNGLAFLFAAALAARASAVDSRSADLVRREVQ